LSTNIGELESLKTALQERGEGLRTALNQVQKADRMKTAFLHNMTNQMLEPAVAIGNAVDALCDSNYRKGQEKTSQLVADIQQNGKAITELLNGLLNISDEEKFMGEKEVNYG
jgi:methyl-accepting chemotaxis protein